MMMIVDAAVDVVVAVDVVAAVAVDVAAVDFLNKNMPMPTVISLTKLLTIISMETL